jgi:hypothetical protein
MGECCVKSTVTREPTARLRACLKIGVTSNLPPQRLGKAAVDLALGVEDQVDAVDRIDRD